MVWESITPKIHGEHGSKCGRLRQSVWMTEKGIAIEGEKGAGRTVVIAYSAEKYRSLAEVLFHGINEDRRSLVLRFPAITGRNWKVLGKTLRQTCNEKSIRHAHFVAFGSVCAVVLEHVLSDPDSIRSIVLTDATVRAGTEVLPALADRVERYLPFGLPLRSARDSFDARSFLHRVRCPVLVLTSGFSTARELKDSAIFPAFLPTSWKDSFDSKDAFTHVVLDFLEIPARSPQKRNA